MELIVIHGPVASGKLTVARELAHLTGIGVFHNHLVVDALTAVFAFGSEPFVALRERMWLSVFQEAARYDVSLIFTFTPERTVRPTFIDAMVDVVESAGGMVRLVQLTCPVDERERRVQDPSRAGYGKLRSPELVRGLSDAGAFAYPSLPRADLLIDTSVTSPREAAEQICAALGLDRRSDEGEE
jgi:hypothetical protein